MIVGQRKLHDLDDHNLLQHMTTILYLYFPHKKEILFGQTYSDRENCQTSSERKSDNTFGDKVVTANKTNFDTMKSSLYKVRQNIFTIWRENEVW